MELVRGIKITDYCNENTRSTRERLELFIQVCQAIQHAHQKAIIHRDIKPSNILVIRGSFSAPDWPWLLTLVPLAVSTLLITREQRET